MRDALTKHPTDFYPMMDIIFFRILFAVPLILCSGLLVSGKRTLVTHAPWLQRGRDSAAIASLIASTAGVFVLAAGRSVQRH